MKAIIAAIVVGAVIVGGYFIVKANKTLSDADHVVETTTQQKPSGKKMAFEQLVKQGGAYECTVHQYVNDTDTIGKVKIKNGNLRGEFSTNYNNTVIDTHVIIKEGFAYTWTSAMPSMGFKAKLTQDESGNVAAGTSGKYTWNYAQIGDYDCKIGRAHV